MYGIGYWVVVFAAPIIGALGSRFGAKAILNFGGVFQAIGAFLLASLYYVKDKNVFLAFSYVAR